MEKLRDHVLKLQEKGLPPKSIRQEVLGKEDAWNLITGRSLFQTEHDRQHSLRQKAGSELIF